jgi:RIO kinase 1
MRKQTNYGKKKDEDEWRSTEADIIYRLHAADVTVPEPYHYVENVLIMALVRDAQGKPAPRLADVQPSPSEARVIFDHLLAETVRMLCAGVVHGDLSEFNVLMSATGPVIIDFPQAVDPAKNRNAKRILFRDIENIERILSRRSRRQQHARYGQEIWQLYEKQLLTPDTRLTGRAPKQKSLGANSILAEMEALDRAARERRAALGLPPPRARTAIIRDVPKKPVASSEKPAATSSSRRRRRRKKAAPQSATPAAANSSAQGPTRGPSRNKAAVSSKADAQTTNAAKPRSGRRRRRRRPGKSSQE